MLRVVIAAVCLVSGTAVEARRGVNDSGDCVDPCRLARGEPCPPCPPPNTTGPGLFQALQAYQVDVAAYEAEISAYAATNPEFRNSDRYRAAVNFISRSQSWIVVMHDYRERILS